MTASLGEAVLGDLLTFVFVVPAGLVLLRIVERALFTRFDLRPVERVLLAFYSAGGLLFLLATIPIPWFGTPLIVVVLAGGAVAYVILELSEQGRGALAALRLLRSPAGLALTLGSVLLLVYELIPVWNHPFPNAWDGSVTALWTTLTLTHHTLPTNLEPFAPAPVVYPLGTTVWIATSATLFASPVVQTIVLLPPLFLSLTVPAAYCWGARWTRSTSVDPEKVGLLFAGFFALVASWPRFYTGGSYDFAFALPLLLLGIGLLPGLVRGPPPPWRKVAGLGLCVGLLASMSVAAAEALLGLLVGYILLVHRQSVAQLTRWLARALVVGGLAVVPAFRGLLALARSNLAPYNVANAYGPLDARLIQGSLDPFVPWKYLVSPFPVLSLLIQVLLVVGVALAAYSLLVPARPDRWLPRSFAADLLASTSIALVMTALLLLTDLPGPLPQTLREVSNLSQASVLLMIFYSTLALAPLVGALTFLSTHPHGAPATVAEARPASLRRRGRWTLGPGAPSRPIWAGFLAILIIAAPLAVGAVVSIADGTGFIEQNVAKTSNVTASDVAVMQWVGTNLPACSRVLVAPGSAGQFLPVFASVHLLYPMNPVPTNGSYLRAIDDLTAGVYSSPTRSALLSLSVTEVLVTGNTSVSFPAFVMPTLENSPDFVLLFGAGHASVFAFLPGIGQTGCLV